MPCTPIMRRTSRVTTAPVDEGLAKGFLLEEDARRLRAQAAAAAVP